MNTTPGPDTGGTATAPPPPPPPPGHGRPPWRFVRHERGKVIAGVTTGMADALHIDVLVVRVIWVIVTVGSAGLGLAAYAICWLAFPSDQHPAPLAHFRFHDGDRHRSWGAIAGAALLVGGIVVFANATVPPFHRAGSVIWATILILAGLAVLLLRQNDEDGPDDTWTAAPPSRDPGLRNAGSRTGHDAGRNTMPPTSTESDITVNWCGSRVLRAPDRHCADCPADTADAPHIDRVDAVGAVADRSSAAPTPGATALVPDARHHQLVADRRRRRSAARLRGLGALHRPRACSPRRCSSSGS